MEPIAVVGLSFKLPQDMDTAESLWTGIATGKCAWSPFPKSRLNFEGTYDPDEERLNSFPLKGGHFISGDISAFDGAFFNIGPREAAEIDPQSRLLLETTYRALENAGITLEAVANSDTSVYVGSFGDDYKTFSTKDPQFSGQYSASSVSPNMLANRISWYFNLRGESVNMDAACSSTLVAFHAACQALRRQDSQMAIVAGSNLFLSPDMAMSLNNQQLLSPDGRSWSFSEKANGYGRGEGVGALILKRLSNALSDNDVIRAVIRATGINQDGRTPGITQPSSKAQAELIKETYRRAGLDMRLTRYVEAHGTGTPVGDPIEAAAIAQAFRDEISTERPMFVGSIKSNVGHLEGTSGIAGLIKSILVLEQGSIPPIAGLTSVNPSIARDHPALKFPQDLTPWPSQGLRRLSISSFGFGGTNAHVVMEDAHNHLRLRNTLSSCEALSKARISWQQHNSFSQACLYQNQPRLLVFSAYDKDGIKRLISAYDDYFSRLAESQIDGLYIEKLVYTLSDRRSFLPWKSFAVINEKQDLQRGIKALQAIRSIPGVGLAFCFTGQGAQWNAMGQELQVFDIFLKSLAEISVILEHLNCPWSLYDELDRNSHSSKVNEPEYSQTLCTAIQIALVDLLKDLGLVPAVVFGHSSGEIAASYCVGALDKQSAIKVAYHRGSLTSNLARTGEKKGAMLSANISVETAQSYFQHILTKFGELEISIGCINSPNNVTVTGDLQQINYLQNLLETDSIFTRKLKVNVAYHSSFMSVLAQPYLKALGSLRQQNSTTAILMVSSVTADVISNDQLCLPAYWVRNLLSPVKFSEAVARAIELHVAGWNQQSQSRMKPRWENVLEIGPHSALQAPLMDIFKTVSKGASIKYHSALVRNVKATSSLLEALGTLHSRGHVINFTKLNDPQQKRSGLLTPLTSLPEYPFDHTRSYWRESRMSQGNRLRQCPRNDFLGIQVPDWNPREAKWRKRIKLSEDPWIEDHKIANVCLLPGAAMLVMAIEGAKIMSRLRSTKPISGYSLRDVLFHRALTISAEPDGTEIEVYLRPIGQTSDRDVTWLDFRLYIVERDTLVEVCRCQVWAEPLEETQEVNRGLEIVKENEKHQAELTRIEASCPDMAETSHIYQTLARNGIDFGPAHQVIEEFASDANIGCVGKINLHKWEVKGRKFHQRDFTIHPTTLDGLFQLGLVSVTKAASKILPSVVTSIRKIWIAEGRMNDPEVLTVPAYSKPFLVSPTETITEAAAFDNSRSGVICLVNGLEGKMLDQSNDPRNKKHLQRLCWNLDFRPDVDLLDQKGLLECITELSPTRPAPIQLDYDVKLLLRLCILRTLRCLTPADVARLASHHRRYIEWMEYECGKPCGVCPIDPSDSICNADDISYEKLLNRLEQVNKQGKFFAVIAKNLHNILLGKVDALEVMFQTSLVKDYYRELYKSTNGLSKALAYLDLYAHKHPDIKILEIGAGTGGMTNYVLDILTRSASRTAGAGTPRFAQYTYTDVSAGFFEDASAMFVAFPEKVIYKVLDIEKDPTLQGFEPEHYDIVIADNVFHATQNLDVTVNHTRRLLKPGGKLVLFELTDPEVIKTNFAFGLLPGWWRSADNYRRLSAGVSDSTWDTILRKAGFSGVDLNLRDFDEHQCHEHSVLISTAKASSVSPVKLPPTSIVFDPTSTLQKRLSECLSEQLGTMGAHTTVRTLKEAAALCVKDRLFYIILLDLDEPVLQTMSASEFEDIKKILLVNNGRVLWACMGGGRRPEKPDHALIHGALRGLRMENTGAKLISLSLEAQSVNCSCIAKKIQQIFEMAATSSAHDGEQEYVERDGHICIDRLIEADHVNQELPMLMGDKQHGQSSYADAPPVALGIASTGLLETLEFVEDEAAGTQLAADEIEIRVEASGVNFRDCLIALGRIPSRSFGFECSGMVNRIGHRVHHVKIGDRVCASTLGTYQTYARCEARDIISIENSMSFTEAAAIPVVFTTAYYALVQVASIRKGDSILIHSAAGGTGQAAIQIAQLYEANIYVTVGSEDKKQLLRDLYHIPEDHIFYSRNLSFAKGVQRMTRAKGGVDIILNSLSGNFLTETWECIAPFGKFLELGKKDILNNASLPMRTFAKNASFHAIDLNEARKHDPALLVSLRDRISVLLAGKKIRPPQPIHTFGIGEVEKAFRYLQSGKNTGKAVVEMRAGDTIKTTFTPRLTWSFDKNATYVIAGGLGGIGRSTARWMADRGARSLILLSRSGARSAEARQFIATLRAQGVQLSIPICDIADRYSLQRTLDNTSRSMPPIKGCIHSAVQYVVGVEISSHRSIGIKLMDGQSKVFEDMTYADWTESYKSKVHGSWNLHSLLPKGMDFFIFYSSIAGCLGGTASANYSSGCAYQDALAHYRNRIGERATTLNPGVMLDDGVLRDNDAARNAYLSTGYLIGIKQHEMFGLLNWACDPSRGIPDTPMRSQVVVGVDVPSSILERCSEVPPLMQRPLFRGMWNITGGKDLRTEKLDGDSQADGTDVVQRLTAAGIRSMEDAASVIAECVMLRVGKALGVPKENFDPSKALHAYGVDSLVAVELRNWFRQKLDAEIAVFEILGEATFEDIGGIVAGKSGIVEKLLLTMKEEEKGSVDEEKGKEVGDGRWKMEDGRWKMEDGNEDEAATVK